MSEALIIEAIAQALYNESHMLYSNEEEQRIGRAILTAITPLIEAAALERAAKVAEKHTGWPATVPEQWAREEVAAAIRALKEQS